MNRQCYFLNHGCHITNQCGIMFRVILMTFRELLIEYSSKYDFTFKELSDKSGISTGTLSNYRSGRQMPKMGSPKIKQLASGIAQLARKSGKTADVRYSGVGRP